MKLDTGAASLLRAPTSRKIMTRSRNLPSSASCGENPALKNVKASSRESAAITIGLCRSEEHTSELQSLMSISYAVFCLKKKKKQERKFTTTNITSKYNYHKITTHEYTLLIRQQ